MILAVVQARMRSTRLPGKVMKEILGKPLIGHVLERLSRSRLIDKIIVATSTDPTNDVLCHYVGSQGFETFRGSEEDVLDRYYQAAVRFRGTALVRITADCPLVDRQMVDQVIERFQKYNFDYVCNFDPPTYPDGLDVGVFTFRCLEMTWQKATKPEDREHVSLYTRNSGEFKIDNVVSRIDLSNERWTVDREEDFILVKTIFENLYPTNPGFTMEDILAYKAQNPKIFTINQHIPRNEGLRDT